MSTPTPMVATVHRQKRSYLTFGLGVWAVLVYLFLFAPDRLHRRALLQPQPRLLLLERLLDHVVRDDVGQRPAQGRR